MVNHRLTAMPAERPFPVMPVQTGIHLSSAEHWTPACAGMTIGKHLDHFDSARREEARLAADAEDMAALEHAERQLEGKGRVKKQ